MKKRKKLSRVKARSKVQAKGRLKDGGKTRKKTAKTAKKSKVASRLKVDADSVDKVFLQTMIEDLLPQMSEKILSRAKQIGQMLRKKKLK